MPTVVVAILNVKPGAEDALLAAVEPAIATTHGEDGCLSYALHRDTQEPTRFVFVERWTSPQTLEAHRQSAHLAELGAKLGDLVTAPPEILVLDPVPFGDAEKGAL